MALTADNVNVAVTGKVYVGATSAAAPTSATSTLSGFTELGFVDQDGVNFSNDKSTSQIRAWQNSALIREVISEATTTYTFMLMEANSDVLELFFGSAVVAGKVQFNPANSGGRKSFVIDVVDGTDVIRHYIPQGEVTAIEAQSFVSGEAIKYGVTVTAYVASDRVADIYYAALAS
jgi:hypothetical protein